jgi:hypothetical protein
MLLVYRNIEHFILIGISATTKQGPDTGRCTNGRGHQHSRISLPQDTANLPLLVVPEQSPMEMKHTW